MTDTDTLLTVSMCIENTCSSLTLDLLQLHITHFECSKIFAPTGGDLAVAESDQKYSATVWSRNDGFSLRATLLKFAGFMKSACII